MLVFNLPLIPSKILLITSNIWHNPTTIFLMPFAVFLFLDSLFFIKKPNIKRLYKVVFPVLIVSIFIKPSFFFCFGVVFPVLSFYCLKQVKYGFNSLFLGFIGAMIVFFEFFFFFMLRGLMLF